MHYDIVVVGGGAGGLELASRLGRRLGGRHGKRRVLLIDRSSFHIWKPTLHEVAAGTLDVHQEGVSYSILGRSNGFNFLLGELATFDPVAKRLTLKAITDQDGQVLAPERAISFTYGVLAIGSGSNLSAPRAPSGPICWSAPRTPRSSTRGCWRPSPRPRSRPTASCASPSSAAARPASSCRPS